MAYKIRFNKLYGKYQVYENKFGNKVVLEEFRKKSSAKKFIKENS